MTEMEEIKTLAKDIFSIGELIEGIDRVHASLHGADDDPESHYMRIARGLYNLGWRSISDDEYRVDELKPCPFCGGKAEIIVIEKGVQSVVRCTTTWCGFERSCYNNRSSDNYTAWRLAKRWNTRTNSGGADNAGE